MVHGVGILRLADSVVLLVNYSSFDCRSSNSSFEFLVVWTSSIKCLALVHVHMKPTDTNQSVEYSKYCEYYKC